MNNFIMDWESLLEKYSFNLYEYYESVQESDGLGRSTFRDLVFRDIYRFINKVDDAILKKINTPYTTSLGTTVQIVALKGYRGKTNRSAIKINDKLYNYFGEPRSIEEESKEQLTMELK